jgi:hypothetical protein
VTQQRSTSRGPKHNRASTVLILASCALQSALTFSYGWIGVVKFTGWGILGASYEPEPWYLLLIVPIAVGWYGVYCILTGRNKRGIVYVLSSLLPVLLLR